MHKMTHLILPGLVLSGLITTTPALAQAEMSDEEKLSYALGVFFSQNIMQQDLVLDKDAFLLAVSDMLNGQQPKLSPEEIKTVFTRFREQQAQKQNAIATKNLEAGKKFLAENGKKTGVVTTPSGLQYKIIRAGEGEPPATDATYTVHYRGTLMDGHEFDSSYARQQPLTFTLNGVIAGWQEALPMMRPGAKWQLFIPPELAYGAQGQGEIQPQSTLLFDIELLSAK